MARQQETLSELVFVEREMSWLADEAAQITTDPEVAERLRAVRDRHEQAAARLADVVARAGGFAEVPVELREEVRLLQAQVRHALDDTDVVMGMLQAERADVRLHEEVIDAGLAEDTSGLVREQLSIQRDTVDLFEEILPGLAGSPAYGTEAPTTP